MTEIFEQATPKEPAAPFGLRDLEALPYPTPFFVFSRQKILSNLRCFQEVFPGSQVHYAMKANSEAEVLATLADAGAGFEVASKFELELLQRLHVSPEQIIYGSAIKPSSHIEAFHEYGVDRFAFDSYEELIKIATAAPGARVFVRTAVDDSGSVFKFSGKFGAEPSEIARLLTEAQNLELQPYGISFHVGSQASDPGAWASALKMLNPIISELAAAGISIDALNLGGGYPCRYASNINAPTLRQIANRTLRAVSRLPQKVELILEPGRSLVADAGVLVTTVIGRVERRGVTWLFLDAGVYNALFEAMAYQGSTRYRMTSLGIHDESTTQLFALAGPTGDSPDIVARDVSLPISLDIGDKLAIHDVGAYSLSVTSSFNGFPKPAVYFL